MRSLRSPLVEWPWVCAVLGLLVCLGASPADEGKGRLELKKLKTGGRVFSGRSLEETYRFVYPQYLFARLDEDRLDPQFTRLVKKEPKYNARRPLRGVISLAGQEFAIAVDSKEAPKTEEKDKKPDKGEKKQETLGRPARLDRLYFDANHNGDLTDDKPLDAAAGGPFGVSSLATFPRVDMRLQLEGKTFDYAFFLEVYSYSSRQMSYATASFCAAAYREGELELGGKPHKVVLLDFNSNGRFDDPLQLETRISSADGALYPKFGDVLLLDPDKARFEWSGYDLMGAPYRHQVSKLVNLEGRFHEMTVSACGDEIRLRPVSPPLGRLGTPHDAFQAMLLGPQGAIRVDTAKGRPAAVPEGEWKLLAYKLTATPPEKKPAAGEKAEKAGSQSSIWGAMAAALFGVKRADDSDRSRLSVVQARATRESKPVVVTKDGTTALAFGPPYRPVVKVQFVDTRKKEAEARLELVLVGAGGEVCSSLLVDGNRPPDPEFTIRDAKDKIIQQGRFKYG